MDTQMETRIGGNETAMEKHLDQNTTQTQQSQVPQKTARGLDNSVINDINMLSHNHSITQTDLTPAKNHTTQRNSRARTQAQTAVASSQNTQGLSGILNKNGTLRNILSSQALKDQQPVFVPLEVPDGEEADRRVCQYYFERYKQLVSEPTVRNHMTHDGMISPELEAKM